jgi:hypothetical protein
MFRCDSNGAAHILLELPDMTSLGLHFSLDAVQLAVLKAVDEEGRVDFVQDIFEEELWNSDRARGQETDKAWDAIHRSLTDGGLEWNNGSYPLNHVILGGEPLYSGDDYVISLKSPEQVQDIAAALASVTRETLREGYDRLDPAEYGVDLSDDDFEYTWDWFTGLKEFYQRAAAEYYAVLFTVDL